MNTEQEYTREELAQMLTDSAHRLWNQFKTAGSRLLNDWGGYDLIDKTARLATQYPFAALSVMLGFLVIFLPFTILLAFGLSTMAITFTGFMLLEGTLLTIASILLFGCLGAILLVFLFFGILTLIGYFGFAHIYDLYNKSNDRSALRQFLRRERTETEQSR
ncbi:uncharacterized protein LOC129910347 [Episyrphus balteatus]|uniref:uncharacterized protein LOC129910347 n=1 Tax=Episyrphus balteatus TaxID=286459 RepID=UPI002485D6CD|nr:uncharacterized protein LOC129910347 [Episyrphus balteatus]